MLIKDPFNKYEKIMWYHYLKLCSRDGNKYMYKRPLQQPEITKEKNYLVEKYNNIWQRLQIISSALLETVVSVDWDVTGRACQILVRFARNVLAHCNELFGQAKVSNVDLARVGRRTHQKIVGFDIAVNDIQQVNLCTCEQLAKKLHI